MFVISVYDLRNGDEILHEEHAELQEALNAYAIAAKHYTNYHSFDCFGVLLYCGWEEAPILFGFDEDVTEAWKEARG